MRRMFNNAKRTIRLIQAALPLLLIAVNAHSATSGKWQSTDWGNPQAIIVAPGASGIPYVEQAELGPPSIGVNGNRFGFTMATWQDASTSWLAASSLNEIDDSGAVYVFSWANSSAVWHQEARLTANDATEEDGFGSAVAIGENIVVVGAPYHKIGSISGAVYTFVRDSTNGKWTQRGDALGASTSGSFGYSIALNGDTLAVAAPGVGTSGHVFVYQNSGTSWTIVGSLSPSDSPPGAAFGESIALDNGRMLIGAPADSTFAKYEGSAYVFAYQSATTSWEQQQKLVPYPDGNANDYFGETVAILGQIAVVAAPGRNSSQGAVDLFSFDSGHGVWLKEGVLQGSGSFGRSLALSSDTLAVGSFPSSGSNFVSLYTLGSGTATFQSNLPAGSQLIPGNFGQSLSWSNGNLLVAAPGADVDSYERGLIYQFSPIDSGWTERQPIGALGDQGEYFGVMVAVSGDVAVIQARNQTDDYGQTGAADIYSRDTDGNWVWQQELSDNFNGPVAVDGNTLVIGAPYQSFGDSHAQGAAYIYGRSGGKWVQQAELGDLVSGIAGDELGTSVALSGDTALVGAAGINKNVGGAYVYVRSGASWTRQAQLTPSEATGGDYVGETVALRGNTALVGAPYSFGGTTGAVYVFQRNGTVWTEKKKLVPSDGVSGDDFGVALALSDNAAFIGADLKDVGSTYQQGRFYIFSDPTWNTETIIDSPAGIHYGRFGGSLAVDGNRLVVGENGQNSVYTYYSDKGTWTLQSTLMDVIGSSFGISVAASNGTVLVGAYNEGNGSSPGGRTYIFQDDRIFANGVD